MTVDQNLIILHGLKLYLAEIASKLSYVKEFENKNMIYYFEKEFSNTVFLIETFKKRL